MLTIVEALKRISSYPIPQATVLSVMASRGLSEGEVFTPEVQKRKEYNLATADLLNWLSLAPNVSQGGQSYSFSSEERKYMRQQASLLYDEFEDESPKKTIYGYKGSRL